MVDNISKEVKSGIEQVAAEFKYIKELENEVSEALEDEDLSKAEKDLKRAHKTLKYLGRTEKKEEKSIQKILNDLEELIQETNSDELKEVYKNIQVPEKKLVKNASRYVGELSKEVKHALIEIQAARKQNTEFSESIKEEIQDIEDTVEEMSKWVKSLQASLKKAKNIEEKMSSVTTIDGKYVEESEYKALNTIAKDYFNTTAEKLFETGNTRSKTDILIQRGHVTSLSIRGKDLPQIPEPIQNLKELGSLYLRYNNISKIENISGLPKLERIDLRNNKIKNIENFDNLPNLKRIDLGTTNQIKNSERNRKYIQSLINKGINFNGPRFENVA